MLVSVIILVLMATSCRGAPKETNTCSGLDSKCKESSECCTGCCHEYKCTSDLGLCVRAATSPCFLHSCPSGKMCYLAKVECLQPPCEPPTIPACRSIDTDYY